MNDILVSVIVPIYNKETYLADCLNSILKQTLSSIQVILIDDGSTDNSKVICERFLKDKRVSYYYQENKGLASARQAGINKAIGEYIGFIDADDWIELDMFEKMYKKAKEYDADVVFCNRMDNDGSYLPSKDIPSGHYDRSKILLEVLPKTLAYIGENGEKRVISWSNCRRIYKRKMLSDIGFSFDSRFRRSQDLQLTYETMLYANSFYYLGDERFYHTRIVSDSLSRGYTHNMWDLYVPLIERLYQDTKEFEQLNLMDQMHLRAFFFATDCIENEFKPLCLNDKATRIEKISEIINHPICENLFGQIPIEKMNDLYQYCYKMMVKKNAKGIYNYFIRYQKQLKRKEKFIIPFMNFLTESKIIGSFYKFVRKRK